MVGKMLHRGGHRINCPFFFFFFFFFFLLSMDIIITP